MKPPVPRIDWRQVIADLERAGLTFQAIAREADRSTSWVDYLLAAADREPKFHDGLMLLGLWKERTGREQAPLQ